MAAARTGSNERAGSETRGNAAPDPAFAGRSPAGETDFADDAERFI
jgi:hypothetical protein